MESLNLNTLASSLPPSNRPLAEKSLLDDFKAAAASVTTLYRTSLKVSKRSYDQGYAAACHEILAMIQQGVSDHADPAMHVGRVMDWLEARLEALRAREEEEEEDEERSVPSTSTNTSTKPQRATSATVPVPREPAPRVPSKVSTSTMRHPSPPPPALRPASQPAPIPASAPAPRPMRTRAVTSTPASTVRGPHTPVSTPTGIPFVFGMEPQQVPLVPPEFSVSAGAKRRHAMMMMLDSPAEGSAAPTTGSRKRTKSARNGAASVTAREEAMMDVEEEGRERKRVARR